MSVTPETRIAVLERDRQCIPALLDPSHRCADRWGQPHPPTDVLALTIDHIRPGPGGSRIDHPDRLVAACHRANVTEHWSSVTDNRALANAYLYGVRAGAGR